jgi:endonuclease-3
MASLAANGGEWRELTALVETVDDLLEQYYGPPALKPQLDPTSELVQTILSQNTSDINSGRAFEQLRRRCASWDQVLELPTAELEAAIRPAGLARVRAPRIPAGLRQIRDEHGSTDLGFLRTWPVEQARAYLTSLPGVGPKTAACVLLFSLHLPALPVDTHVHRVAGRVGLIPRKVSAEKAHLMLAELVPPARYYPFHLLMIQHGRTVCKAPNPQCAVCPLVYHCQEADSGGRVPAGDAARAAWRDAVGPAVAAAGAPQ